MGLRFPLPPHPTPPPLRASLEKEVGERRRIVVASRGSLLVDGAFGEGLVVVPLVGRVQV